LPSLESFGRILIIGGGLLAATGLLLLLVSRLGIGHLPGDIFIQRGNFTFYFPLVTMLVISIILTILINFIRR
jgi:uncharacterized membrane protein (DUF106 family)